MSEFSKEAIEAAQAIANHYNCDELAPGQNIGWMIYRIEQAILTERAKCAEIAEFNNGKNGAGTYIAQRIREGKR